MLLSWISEIAWADPDDDCLEAATAFIEGDTSTGKPRRRQTTGTAASHGDAAIYAMKANPGID
jgi:hypothetical protein